MGSLQEIAIKYDKHAARILAREDTKSADGKLLPQYQDAVNYYRTAGDAVRALIRPEDSEESETQWNLESTRVAQVFHHTDKPEKPKSEG
jgi:hypothetical protein